MHTTERVDASSTTHRSPGHDPVDLSQPLRTALPVVPGDPGVRIEPFASHDRDGYAMTHLHMGSHSGTHIDAPRHFIPEGRTLDDYPVARFVGLAAVLDLRGLEPDSEIPAQLLRSELDRVALTDGGSPRPWFPAEKGGAEGPPGFVLLWLGWDAHFGDDLMWRHPYLTAAGARLLVDRGANLVGTDAASVDRSAVMESFPAHQVLLGRDVLVVENLCRLHHLGAGHATCVFLPLPIAGADGAPMRAIAWPEAVTA